MDIVKGQVIEDRQYGDGPRWIATLEDGTTIIGKPSWMSSHNVALPYPGSTDWQRLMAKCREENVKLRHLKLFVPKSGLFEAEKNAGGYGYFEDFVISYKNQKQGVKGLAICWCETDSHGTHIKVMKVNADGTGEIQHRTKWLPCMIGDQQTYAATKDEGVKVN